MYAWGTSVVVLGAWEAAAFTTRRIPTVSTFIWRGTGCRHKRVVQALVIVYLAGVARHLLDPASPAL